MIQPRELLPGVQWRGVVDWDRRLFDALMPLRDGTSYNAYLIRGSEKTALIDSVDSEMAEAWMRQFDEIPSVDYLVANHAEQDHSGALPRLLLRYPQAVILCTPKAKGMLEDLLGLPAERFRVVEDGATVDLGGLTLRFVHLPWVHWPETMGTWLEEKKILFSCDFFGSHLATSCLYADEDPRTQDQARSYFAQIMMPYANVIRKNLGKVRALSPQMIAPSHGPVWRDPKPILDLHDTWLNGPPRNRVVIARVSMHGSTRVLADALEAELVAQGVNVQPFDLTEPALDAFASALVDAGTLVLAASAVWGAPHPLAVMAAYVASGLKPKVRWATVVGSYGWSPKGLEDPSALLPGLKAEFLPPVLAKGYPQAESLGAVRALAHRIAEAHRAANLQ